MMMMMIIIIIIIIVIAIQFGCHRRYIIFSFAAASRKYLEAVHFYINPLNAELNPICHLLALLGAHHILHVCRIRVKAAGAWRLPPTPSSAEVKEGVELYLYFPTGSSWAVQGWYLPLWRILILRVYVS
jgi:hypothetical protein